MKKLHQALIKSNSQTGSGLWRYFVTMAIVVPVVLFFLACAGGDGITEPPINDRICVPWQQSVDSIASAVDVLWVVDQSGSMCHDQERLSQGIENAAAALAASGITDIHMGVTTSDIGADAGKLQLNSDGSKYITNLSNASLNLFKDTVLVGCNGSGQEEGSEAAVLATQAAFNAGFFRANSYHAYIHLTDENDDSGFTNAEAVDPLLAAVDDVNKLKIHFIGHTGDPVHDFNDPDLDPLVGQECNDQNLTPEDPCYNCDTDEPGTKYLNQMSYLEGVPGFNGSAGVIGYICEANYDDLVPELIVNSTVFTATTFVALGSTLGFVPDISTLVISALDANNDAITIHDGDWTFVQASNIVVLNSAELQQPGVHGEVCAKLGQN